jgi:diguanylate cyclase (GGDEF)-like protein/PAS domain S-box-containing protein
MSSDRPLTATDGDSRRLFETAFAGAPTGMALVALDGGWLRVNAALCRMLGFTEAQLRTRTFQDITHPDDLEADLEHVHRLLAGEASEYTMEKRYISATGAIVWALLSVSLLRDDDGEALHFVSHVVDITERKEMEDHLRTLATHDGLTGIWNRRRFEEEVARQVARAMRHRETAALLVIDLDGFKPVNDRLGHDAGDQLLRAIARAVSRRIRGTDSVARLGGDEFAVLLTNTDLAAARKVAADLAELIRTTAVHVGNEDVAVGASVGVEVVDASTRSVAEALARADAAMYAAKSGLRNAA